MVSKVRTLFAACCCAALLFGIAGPAHAAGCAKDTDCKGARICVKNACVDAPPVRTCGRDLDCPGDDICEQHICIAPARARSGKNGKPLRRRDLIKEAERQAAEEAKAQSASSPAAPAVAPASGEASATSAPPAPLPPPPPPPSLIKGDGKSEPARSEAAPEPAKSEPARPASESPPAEATLPSSETKAAAAPPAPPLPSDAQVATPPPPLVSATVPNEKEKHGEPSGPAANEGDDAGRLVYSVGLTGGYHHWTFSQGANSNSEGDLGLNLTGEFGFRIAHTLGIVLLADGGYTPMADSVTGLVGGLGAGLRLDHLSAIPGRFTLGALASFTDISKSTTPPAAPFTTIDESGLQLMLQWGLPVIGPLALDLRTSLHFFSNGLTLFSLTVGAAFGN